MTRLLSVLAAAIALGLVVAFAPAALGAAPYQPQLLNLHAADEEAWHADNDFQLRWDRPTWSDLEFPVTAVHYEIDDAAGNPVVAEARIPGEVHLLDHVHVPSRPGAYTIDVWLEGSGGVGEPQSATLRFDDARPGLALPLAPTGWIGAESKPVLRIEHPAGPLPASGIRGYAISVGPDAAGAPCAGPDRCSEAETDLRGGVGADTLMLAGLPEGVSHLRTVAVSGSGMRSATTGTAVLRVDATRPEVELRGAPHGWANGPVLLSAHAADRLSGMAAAGPAGPYTAIAIDDRVPKSASGDIASAVVSGDGRHRIAAFARDAAGNVSDEAGSSAPSLAVVEIDEDPPVVAFGRSQDPTDPERIEATVNDPLSGPDRLRGAIAVRPAGTRRQFTALPTAVSQGKLTARWDSDAFPAGDYEFRATGYDLAGNSTAADRRSTGARMVLPNPLKRPTAIEAGFGGRRLIWHRCVRVAAGRRCRREVIRSFERRPATRTAPYGRSMPFSGRLISKSGAPLDGLPVQLIETFDAGATPEQRTTTVQTAADGVFLAHLSPGPSRQVEAVFAGNRILTRALAEQRPRLAVLTGVRIRASAATAAIGGAAVVFSGRLETSGASIPSEGMPVEFQYRLPGAEWTGFHTVKTDTHGRFRYAYAFSDDDSRGVRFEFRAYVPAQKGWPYEPAGSRPVFVTGR